MKGNLRPPRRQVATAVAGMGRVQQVRRDRLCPLAEETEQEVPSRVAPPARNPGDQLPDGSGAPVTRVAQASSGWVYLLRLAMVLFLLSAVRITGQAPGRCPVPRCRPP